MKNLRENPITKFELEAQKRKKQDINKKSMVQNENVDLDSN